MFFNNVHYIRYVEKCREAGITVPIIPGLKILTTRKHIKSLPSLFHCEIPPLLADAVDSALSNEEVLEVGVDWARRQTEDLLNRGVPSVHFYVMQSSKAVSMLLDKLGV
jgi:methylenetetrahydrofolate reductase (NADPH)